MAKTVDRSFRFTPTMAHRLRGNAMLWHKGAVPDLDRTVLTAGELVAWVRSLVGEKRWGACHARWVGAVSASVSDLAEEFHRRVNGRTAVAPMNGEDRNTVDRDQLGNPRSVAALANDLLGVSTPWLATAADCPNV